MCVCVCVCVCMCVCAGPRMESLTLTRIPNGFQMYKVRESPDKDAHTHTHTSTLGTHANAHVWRSM